MKKYLNNPLFVCIPLWIFCAGSISLLLNSSKTIAEAWWYTFLPLGIGLVGFMALVCNHLYDLIHNRFK
jgi:hypothetical protein